MPGRHFSHFCYANETPSSSRIKGEQHRSLSCHFHLCRGGCGGWGGHSYSAAARPPPTFKAKNQIPIHFYLSLHLGDPQISLSSIPSTLLFFFAECACVHAPPGQAAENAKKEDRERKQKYFDGPPAGSRLMNREVNSFLLSRNDKSFFLFFVQGKKRP